MSILAVTGLYSRVKSGLNRRIEAFLSRKQSEVRARLCEPLEPRQMLSSTELVPLGGEFQISTTTGITLLGTPSLASSSSGGFVAGWTVFTFNEDAIEYYYLPGAQLFNSDGTKNGSEIYVSDFDPYIYSGRSSVGMDKDGAFASVYTNSLVNMLETGVAVRMFDNTGTALGGSFPIDSVGGSPWLPSMSMNPDGDFVVVWEGNDIGGRGILGRRLNSDGTFNGGEFLVNTTTTGTQQLADVAMAPDGSFVVVWLSPDGDQQGVFGQRYDANGDMAGGEFAVNTYTTSAQSSPSVAIDSTGAFIVTWSSLGQDGSSYGVYAQRFDASGDKAGDEFLVNTDGTTGEQGEPEVAIAGDGSFMIVWQSHNGDGDSYGVMGQYYNPDGTANGSNFVVNTTTEAPQSLPEVVAGANNTFITAWQDGTDALVFGQRFQILTDEAPTVSPLPALAMSENSTGLITLSDYFSDDNDLSGDLVYTIEGNTNPGLLNPTIDSDGSDVLLYVDGGSNLYGAGVLTIRATDSKGGYVEAPLYVDVAGSADRYAVPVSEINPLNEAGKTPFYPSVGMAADGSYVKVWLMADIGEIYGQLFDAAGKAVGDAFEVTGKASGVGTPEVALSFDGSFTVVWEQLDGSNQGIYGRRFDAAGNALGASFQINTVTDGSQTNPAVAVGYDGSFVVGWMSSNGFGYANAVAQRFDADGAKVGGEFALADVFVSTDTEQEVSLAISPMDGSFIATWTRFEIGKTGDIYGRIFDAKGTGGSEFLVNSTTDETQSLSRVSVGANGEFVVVWQSKASGEYQVFGQMYQPDGTPFDGEFQISQDGSNNTSPGVTVAADGTFQVVWTSETSTSYYEILVQRYDNCGCLLGDVVMLESQPGYIKGDTNISGVGSGNFVVSWLAIDSKYNYGIYSQSFELTYQPYVADPIPDVTVWLDATDGFYTDLFGHFGPNSDALVYTVESNSNPGLVSTSVDDTFIDYDFEPGATGSATIVVKATAIDGTFITDEYTITVEELVATLTLPNTAEVYSGNLYDTDLFGAIDVEFISSTNFSTGGVFDRFNFDTGFYMPSSGDFDITFTGMAGKGWIEFMAADPCGCGLFTAKLYIVIEDVIDPEFEGFKAIPSSTSTPVGSVDLFFSEAIDVDSFNWESITLTRDSGANLIDASTGAGLTFTLVNAASNRYRIGGLAELTDHIGRFTLTLVDGGVTDPAGNPLGAGGQIDWEMQAATPSAPVLGPTNAGPYEAGYTSTTTPTVVGTGTPGSTVEIRDGDDQLIAEVVVDVDGNYSYTFGELALGSYTLRAIAYGPGDHVSAPSLDSTFTIANDFVSILTITQFPAPVLAPVNAVGLQFSQGIDLSSFTWEDLVIRRNGTGPNLTNSGITIQRMSPTSLWYRVNLPLSMSVESGNYTFEVVRSNIRDDSGKPIYNNASTSWTRAYNFLEITQFTSPVTTPVTAIGFKAAVPLDIDSLSWEDIQITRDGGPDLSTPGVVVERVSPTSLWYRITLPSSLTTPSGDYVVTVKGAGILDMYGTPIGMDISTSWTRAFIFTQINQFPTPLTTPLTAVGFQSSVALDVDSITWEDIGLTLNGGSDISMSGITVVRVSPDSLWYRINLPGPLTLPLGTYELTVKAAGILDMYGNPIAGNIATTWTRA